MRGGPSANALIYKHMQLASSVLPEFSTYEWEHDPIKQENPHITRVLLFYKTQIFSVISCLASSRKASTGMGPGFSPVRRRSASFAQGNCQWHDKGLVQPVRMLYKRTCCARRRISIAFITIGNALTKMNDIER